LDDGNLQGDRDAIMGRITSFSRSFMGADRPTGALGQQCDENAAVRARLAVSGKKGIKSFKHNATSPVRQMPLILIAESEPVSQQIIRNILESCGYETVVAKDGVEALMQLARRQFDLILSDLLMPDLGGFKLVELLNKKGISTQVVFLKASDDVAVDIKGLSLGAKDYIRKPVNRDQLLLQVRKAFDQAVVE